MSSMIAEEVIKVLAPRVRKIVREEVNKGIKTLIKEQKISQQMMLSNNVNVNNNNNNLTDNLIETKEAIAKRAHDKAKSILEKNFSKDDPFADLIMSARDPQEQQRIEEQAKISKPLVKASEVNRTNVVAADEMDFSEMISRLT